MHIYVFYYAASYIAIYADMDAASDELDQFRKPDKGI